jgi:hypothetical protein
MFLLKIKSFLCFQIVPAEIMKNSIKKLRVMLLVLYLRVIPFFDCNFVLFGRVYLGSPVHVAPACAGSDHFGSYVRSLVFMENKYGIQSAMAT